MEHIQSKVKRLILLLPALIAPVAMNAQVKDFGSGISQWNSMLRGWGDEIFAFVTILCVIIGGIQLIVIYPKFSGGDQHSAAAFLKHGGGLMLVIVILNLFKIFL